jgi:hypothetical protein
MNFTGAFQKTALQVCRAIIIILHGKVHGHGNQDIGRRLKKVGRSVTNWEGVRATAMVPVGVGI